MLPTPIASQNAMPISTFLFVGSLFSGNKNLFLSWTCKDLWCGNSALYREVLQTPILEEGLGSRIFSLLRLQNSFCKGLHSFPELCILTTD